VSAPDRAASRVVRTGLAPGPETSWISALLDGVRSGRGDAPDSPALVIPPGDDAAAVEVPPGERAVLATDASVEGVHFRRAWMTWETIGYRAAASSLSDLAAMAAAPIGLLLSVALPPELDAGVPSAIGRGVGEALAVTGGDILGGDVVGSPGPVMLDVAVVGHAVAPVPRSGACPGDEVWVTGSLGGAAAAVADLLAGLEPTPEGRRAFERPRPRVGEARWLAGRAGLTSLIDISDGLSRDARHVAVASGVRVELELGRIPAHPAVEPYLESPAGLRLLLAGGEDYELLLTASAGAVGPLAGDFAASFGVTLTRSGTVSAGAGLGILGPDGASVPVSEGFDHFAREA